MSAGKKNSLAVRIIDPDGNFTWTDFNPHFWGERRITPSHGFGGITGRVELEWVDPNYISDVFVQNTPEITTVCAKVKVDNLLKQKYPDGKLRFRLSRLLIMTRFYMIRVSVLMEINWMNTIHLFYNILKHSCGVRILQIFIGFK